MLEIGSLIDGKYKILNVIGQGGMSVVYLAINERANKTWAVKEVRKDGIADFEVVKQGLIVETEMLKSLEHPHLPSIIDVIDTRESFIIVMDYIQGESLEKRLQKSNNAPQKKEDVMEWAKQLCDVLGYLHTREKPIIYRDMKPANVMLKPDGNLMLIDFGTAREFKSRSVADTTCLGTRGYAAPEQYGGMGQTDPRTDIYCLGATLYHLITGHSPADPPYEIRPIGEWLPQYAGSGLEAIIIKCTQQDPAQRYQNCAELMYALEHEEENTLNAQKQRERRWKSFLGSCALCLAGIVGMAGFWFAWNNQIRSSYDSLMSMAKNAPDPETMSEYYIQAISLDPQRAEAYEEILSAIDRDYKITTEESVMFISAVEHTDGGSQRSIDFLKSGNREEYEKLCYRVASDYYFFYEGTDNRIRAASWYAEVLESKNITAQQREIAQRLYKIGEYYNSLGTNYSKFEFVEQQVTYTDYWNDLVAITEGDLMEITGHAYIALGLYKNMAVEIYRLSPEFKREGITRQQMQEQLDNIVTRLNAIVPEDDEDREEIQKILKNVEQAAAMLESVFSNKVE